MKQKSALKHLKELLTSQMIRTHPNLPYPDQQINYWNAVKSRETKQLKRIESFLNLIGGCKGNIIDNKGTRIDSRVTYENPNTANQTVGSIEYRKSKIQNGIADTCNIIKGRKVDVELKLKYKKGRDTQSPVQKQYEKEVIEAGGIYVICESFDDFYNRIFWHLYETPFISQNELNALI